MIRGRSRAALAVRRPDGSIIRRSIPLESWANSQLRKIVMLRGVLILLETLLVGMKSLITRSTKPWTIYFGIPAKPLKPRLQNMVELAEQYMRELDES